MILLGGCNSRQVKITGAIQGLDGTVRLLTESPGGKGFSVLVQQEVKDGRFELRTEQIVPPAQVWIDLRGRRMVELIVDAREGTLIEGSTDSLDRIKVTGSSLAEMYAHVKQTLDEKFGHDIENYNARILEISRKEKLTRDDEMKLGKYQLDRQRMVGRRADYVKQMIRSNPPQRELSLFLLKNELVDSLDAQKRLFNTLAIRNKESNIYKILEQQLR
ncbi:MAG: hypothetical protein LBI96_00715 [Odoribacteraceae bacterium]|jgi:hypothetical protein|nr:hypothetical protein [Odoribacteraceae bacterium]